MGATVRSACIMLLAMLPFALTPAEESAARAERFDGLIEALNASSRQRTRVLEVIHGELRGPDGREMQETLREALSRQNSLILQGVAEAMAMQGDSRDVSSLEALLATSDKLEVKTLVIRLLPAFCLPAERARFNYISYSAGYERVPRSGVLGPLRRPPLTRRGRLDTSLERLQGRVVRSLAAQFDPVGAVLPYIDDVLYGTAARKAVVHYVGNSLGNDPGRWARIWAAQGGDMVLRTPDEVEEIRLAALVSLADVGAEGLPEVIEAFRVLFATGTDIQLQSGFETMATMCRVAFDGYHDLAAMNFDAEDAVEADNWRRRSYSSAANLAVYAAAAAGDMVRWDLDTSVFTAAVSVMGAALSYPDDFPDTNGMLGVARFKGIERLERLVMFPDLSREKRASIIRALGEIGTKRSVSAMVSIINSPYCSPESGNDGNAMAETVIDALRDSAVGNHDGRFSARQALLDLLEDDRVYPPIRAGTPAVGMAHMALWRLQRLARSNDVTLDKAVWRERLDW